VSVLSGGLSAACSALLLVSEEGHEAEKFLGLPIWIWQLLNLVLFLGVLLYLGGKPLAETFRKRQADIEQRRQEAEKHRAAVDRLALDIRSRTAKVESEIEEVRKQGRVDGEEARKALAARAGEEAERIRKEAIDEIERRVAAARGDLRQAAADLTAASAAEILTREITPADRERLLSDSVARLKDAR
jgi:F0F1-type ATP synthase membrane subunit b/b'